jgi:hypothetical protein
VSLSISRYFPPASCIPHGRRFHREANTPKLLKFSHPKQSRDDTNRRNYGKPPSKEKGRCGARELTQSKEDVSGDDLAEKISV